MDTKEKAKLHYDLMNVLTNCKTDQEFYKRLMYAKQLIENSLSEFKDDEIEGDENDDWFPAGLHFTL